MARKLHTDDWLFAATVGLALFGVVMVYSASAVVAASQNQNQYHYVVRQGVWTLAGLGVMLWAMRSDYSRLRSPVVVYGLLTVSLVCLVAVFGFSPRNGARRWIHLPGGFTFQPSEVAKLSLTIFLARFLERRAGEEGSFWRTFAPAVFVTGVLAGLVIREPDLGTAMMLGVICVSLLWTAGARLKHMALAAAPALAGVSYLLLFVPFRRERMISFLDPWADAQGTGYQVVQSLLAVGSGGVNGLGFTEGKQKLFFLPFAHSDFIYAVVGEELGLYGALGVVALFGLFLWRGMRAALGAPDRFGMLLGVGVVSSVVVQALFNISVALALLPTKGIPLPFISYGGSSLVPTLFAVGVLLNISQYAGLKDAESRGREDAGGPAEGGRPSKAGHAAPAPANPPRPRVAPSPRHG